METDNTITSCRRCGTCCKRGGPALHVQDRGLVADGVLAPANLFTVRAGELAYHPGSKALMELPDEMIKVRGKGESWECAFLEPDPPTCTIHNHRPIECRALKCWDTGEVESLFLKDLLARRDLCPKGSAAAELIGLHEETFPVRLLHELLASIRAGGVVDRDQREINRLIAADKAFRRRTVEVLGLGEAELEFFFGRSLGIVASRFRGTQMGQ
jgi:Fe-S-cluster containining protein